MMAQTEAKRSPLTTLCYLEKDGQYLMLHRVSKKNDVNKGKWIPKEEIWNLRLWEGDKIFLKLLNEDVPFFSLKLSYKGDELVETVLDGRPLDTDIMMMN